MIKLTDTKINKINHGATEVSFNFEDAGLKKNEYKFLKERLNMFKSYVNSEYSIKSEIRYNEFSEILFIRIIIKIPDNLMPKDPVKSTETIMDPIILFQKFYQAQKEIYQRKYLKEYR
jgi:hypothetical protein